MRSSMPRRCRSSISKRSSRCCDGRGSAAPRRSSTARSSSSSCCSANSRKAWRRGTHAPSRPEKDPATRRAPTRRNKKPTGRKPLPAHLPREQVTHSPQGACSCCGGTVLRKIGEDVTEVLEYVPSAFKVIQHVRPKLSCRACETIVQAPLPSLPIERGRPGPGLLADVAVAKSADGLPLHRQSGIYARDGLDLDRSTMAEWMGRIAALLSPLVEGGGRAVCAGPVMHADDTTVEVLAPALVPTKTRRILAGARGER